MARLTITKAIELSPIGRTQFYAGYIDKGLITVSVDDNDKKYIDSSELVRVFGNIETEQPQTVQKTVELNSSELVTELRERIAELKQDKADLKAENAIREERHQTTIIALTSRLEAPKNNPNPIVRWWRGLASNEGDKK